METTDVVLCFVMLQEPKPWHEVDYTNSGWVIDETYYAPLLQDSVNSLSTPMDTPYFLPDNYMLIKQPVSNWDLEVEYGIGIPCVKGKKI